MCLTFGAVLHRFPRLAFQEALEVEGLLLAPQVVHRPADLRFQHRQRFAFAALGLLPLHPTLHRRRRPDHQAGCFAEGPLQMGVADLLAARAFDLARAGMLAADQPAVREEVADLGEAGAAG